MGRDFFKRRRGFPAARTQSWALAASCLLPKTGVSRNSIAALGAEQAWASRRLVLGWTVEVSRTIWPRCEEASTPAGSKTTSSTAASSLRQYMMTSASLMASAIESARLVLGIAGIFFGERFQSARV